MSAARRDPLPDALRALALLGVLIVNAVNYLVAPTPGIVLGTVSSALDAFVVFVIAAFVQAKAYPLLAFLFGMGLVWAGRGASGGVARQRFSQRQRRIVLLGMAHGTLLYFGDILTLYAISAWTVWSTTRVRSNHALSRLRRGAIGAFVAVAASLVLALFAGPDAMPSMTRLADASTFRAFATINATVYLPSLLFALLLVLPLVRLFMLAGIVAARWRLLTHRRWSTWRADWSRRLLVPALAANVVFGGLAAWMSAAGDHPLWLDTVAMLAGPPLAAWYGLALSRRWERGDRRWASMLAPLGRRTLTVYLGHAFWCAALFSGLGFAWSPGTPTVLLLSITLWLALAWLAARSRRRWPLEWWMGRRA
jgi:uncharacterized protein